MADWGLLGGLAEGLSSGMSTYREMKKEAAEKALKERMAKLDAAKAGYDIDATSGELLERPETKAEREYKAAQYDPDSEQSQSSRKMASGLLKASGIDSMQGLVPDTATAKDITGENSLYGKAITGAYGMQGRLATAARTDARTNVMAGNLNLRTQLAGVHAGQSISKDPILQTYQKTQTNLDRALSMMDGDQPITSKNFAILQQDMINAMAPGGSATEGKVNREMVETLQSRLNDMQLHLGQVKDLRTEQPQIFNQLRGLMNNVKRDYQKAQYDRAQSLGNDFSQATSPNIRNTVQGKLSEYAKPEEPLSSGPKAVQMSPADKKQSLDLIQTARKNGTDKSDPHIQQLMQLLDIRIP